MNIKILVAAISITAFPTLQCQADSNNGINDQAISKIISIGTSDNKVMDHLDVLTNRFGGRLVGSDAYENAAEWMLKEYEKWGIYASFESAGEVTVAFNRVPRFARLLGVE